MKAFVTRASVFGPRGRGVEAWAAGRIDDELLAEALVLRGLRPLSRTARLAMVTAADVLPPDTLTGMRDALVLGSAWSSVGPLADFVQVAAERGEDRVFPMAFPNTVVSVHVGYVATLLGCTGPALSICGEHAGLEAVVEALSLLEAGRADRAVAIGVDSAEPVVETAVGPTAGEGAGALRLSNAVEDEGCLAAITACWTAPSWDEMPGDVRGHETEPKPDLAVGAGAADGIVPVAEAAVRAAQHAEPVVVGGPCGVSGVAAIRFETA